MSGLFHLFQLLAGIRKEVHAHATELWLVDRVSPGTMVLLEKYRFNLFLGALLGRKKGPLVIASPAFQGMPGKGRISLGLAQPILVVYRHGAYPG